MAAADHLVRCYPHLTVWVADLAPSLPPEARAMIVDYIAQDVPCVLVLWHGMRPATTLTIALMERGFRPRLCWVYVRGDGAREALSHWQVMGARVITHLWGDDPLAISGGAECRFGGETLEVTRAQATKQIRA